MPYMILIPAHGLDKFISHLGVCHYITKTHLEGQDTLQGCAHRRRGKTEEAGFEATAVETRDGSGLRGQRRSDVDWTMKTGAEYLPIVEQIPVLPLASAVDGRDE
jgi:hypothetical protein